MIDDVANQIFLYNPFLKIVHFREQLIHRKCARAKMQEIFGHYICFEIMNKNTFGACMYMNM